MKIEKEPLTTDGKPMKIGEKYVFHVGGRDFIGTYIGVGFKESLVFKNVLPKFKNVKFNIKLNSVQSIYEAKAQ